MNEVKRTERGWGGHFICSKDCLFRRNTLLEYKNKKWIISTVGCLIFETPTEPYHYKITTVGAERWYETKAFEAEEYDIYYDADVSKEIEFNSEWGIWGKTWEEVMDKYNQHPDLAANEMHEKVVEELIEKIKGEN